MMNNPTSPQMKPSYLQEISDQEVVTTFPLEYALEAQVLLRRLEYLKLYAQDPPKSLLQALDDVEDIYDVCCGILDAHNQDIDYLIKSRFPNLNNDDEEAV